MWNAQLRARFGEAGPQLLLLDLDGTLIDSVPDLANAVDEMLQALGKRCAGEELVSHWIGNGADMLVRRALANGDEQAALAFDKLMVKNARVYFDAAYLNTLHHATGVYDGVSEFLEVAMVPKVLITNKPRMFTIPLIKSLGWETQFVQVICGDDLADKKPSPMPLLHACVTQKIQPEMALMVGDSRNDIMAAHAANMASVAVSYGYNHGESVYDSNPTWVVNRLVELL